MEISASDHMLVINILYHFSVTHLDGDFQQKNNFSCMFQVSRIYTKNKLRMENFAEYYNYLQQEKLCLSTPDFQTPFFCISIFGMKNLNRDVLM